MKNEQKLSRRVRMMNKTVAKSLKEDLIFELDNLMVEPKLITMSPEFHRAIGRPPGLRGIIIQVDQRSERNWELRF